MLESKTPNVSAIARLLITPNQYVVRGLTALRKRHDLIGDGYFTGWLRVVDKIGGAIGGVGIVAVVDARIANEDGGTRADCRRTPSHLLPERADDRLFVYDKRGIRVVC